MKDDFDMLLAQRQRNLRAEVCPYEGDELRQIVAKAVLRAKAREARAFRRQVLLRYSVAACVAAVLVVRVLFLPTPPSQMMASNAGVSYHEVDVALQGLLSNIIA